MKESDYINLSNYTKLGIAYKIVADITYGKEFGLPKEEFQKLMRDLENIRGRIEKKIIIKE